VLVYKPICRLAPSIGHFSLEIDGNWCTSTSWNWAHFPCAATSQVWDHKRRSSLKNILQMAIEIGVCPAAPHGGKMRKT
jgi:ABC-type uncharacterized transport system YnjBCD permease subunit